MKLTRNGIAHDLKISPYREIVEYKNNSLEFVFSSELYRNKFNEKREEARTHLNNVLSNMYGMRFDVPEVADIRLYSKIEKRGFLILDRKKEAIWLEKVICAGEIKMSSN